MNDEELIRRMEVIHKFYKEHEAEIEGAENGDGKYYILRMLFRALNFNTQALCVTKTVPNDLVRRENKRQTRLIEISNAQIVLAIFELIGGF